MSEAPLRLGLIELGARSIRLLIASVSSTGGMAPITTRSSGSGLAESKNDDESAWLHTLDQITETTSRYRDMIDGTNVDKVCMFATEGVRALPEERQSELLKRLPGLNILEPKEEAVCSLYASLYGMDGGKIEESQHILSIDQGGASMEVATGLIEDKQLHLQSWISAPLGARVLGQRLSGMSTDIMRFQASVKREVSTLELPMPEARVSTHLIGSAPTKLAWLNVRKALGDRYDPRLVHNHAMTRQNIEALVNAANSKQEVVRQLIDPRNPHGNEFVTVISGLIALGCVLDSIGISHFKVNALGTRHGMAWKLFESH